VLTISKGIKLTASNPALYITSTGVGSEGPSVNFTGDNALVTGITIRSTGIGGGGTSSAVQFSSTTATNNYVYNATITTNEFGITNSNSQIQIQNVAFTWTGTPDSHRYIGLYRTTAETFITDCTFAGNGAATPVSRGILLTGSTADYVNGKIIVKGCSSVTNPLAQFFVSEISLASTNFQFYFVNNTATVSNTFVNFYIGNALQGVSTMVVQGNTETLAVTNTTGSKGIIAIDNGSSSGTSITFPPNFYAGGNSQNALVAGWADLSSNGSKVIVYNTAIFTPSGTVTVQAMEGWGVIGNVLGATGAKGDTGVAGPTGAVGPTGTRGTIIFAAYGSPTTGYTGQRPADVTPITGDFFFDINTSTLHYYTH
jgi:hypothetical protein